MSLFRQTDDVTEVGVVNVGVYSKESLEYGFGYCEEILWKSNTWQAEEEDGMGSLL